LHELGILYRSMQELSEAERYFLAAYEKETDEESNNKNSYPTEI